MKKSVKWLSRMLLAIMLSLLIAIGLFNLIKNSETEKVVVGTVPFGITPNEPLERGRPFNLETQIENLEPFIDLGRWAMVQIVPKKVLAGLWELFWIIFC